MTTVREYLDRNNQLAKVESVIDGFVNHSTVISTALDSHRLVINARPTGRLGAYSERRRMIQIHGELLKPANAAKHIDTLLHETAHLIVHIVYPSASAHGREWKSVARKLGIAGDRISKADVLGDIRKARANYVYACIACGYEFHSQRRKKHHPSQYSHKGCPRGLYLKRDNRTGQTFDATDALPEVPPMKLINDPRLVAQAEAERLMRKLRKPRKANLMYACQKCEYEFPAQRTKKYAPNMYSHKRCGGKLYLKRDKNGRTYPNPKTAL